MTTKTIHFSSVNFMCESNWNHFDGTDTLQNFSNFFFSLTWELFEKGKSYKAVSLSLSKGLVSGIKMTSKQFEYFRQRHSFHSLFQSLFEFLFPSVFHTFNLSRLPLETLILPFEVHFKMWWVSWIMYVYNYIIIIKIVRFVLIQCILCLWFQLGSR